MNLQDISDEVSNELDRYSARLFTMEKFKEYQNFFKNYKDGTQHIEFTELIDDMTSENYHAGGCEVNDAEDLISAWNWMKGDKVFLVSNQNKHMGPDIEWIIKEVKDNVLVCIAKVVAIESFIAEFVFAREDEQSPWERHDPGSEKHEEVKNDFKVLKTLKQ